MAATVARGSNSKIGTCPHGLPLGACPICNGMGGGGSVKKDNKPREMTWNECYAIGQMLKAQKLARQNTQKMFAAQDMNAYLNRLQTQINNLKLAVLNSILPKPIAKAVALLADAVLMPAVKIAQAVTNAIQNAAAQVSKAMNHIKQFAADIMDKLTAVFGEAKAAIQKKIDEKFKDIKKKVFNLFGISEAENEEDEEVKRIEEEKKMQEEQKIFESDLKEQRIPQNLLNEIIESEEK